MPIAGFVLVAGDCKDNDATVYPGAPEICDGKDNDCNGLKDDGAPGVVTWYRDADGDTYGNAAISRQSCLPIAGFVLIAGDCKDNDASVYTGATEVCDGKDNDCDGQKDEACATITGPVSDRQLLSGKPILTHEKPGLEISLWPNPARDVLTVSLENFEPGKNLEIVLLQADGRPVASQSLIPATKGQQVRFNLHGKASGYYLVQTKQGLMQQTKRLMILR